MQILVTGGPVHAKLDAVKVITNGFKGGLMAKLADELSLEGTRGEEVDYLCSKGSRVPDNANVYYHDGFYDYEKFLLEYANEYDAVVLGAAVANLLPVMWQTVPGGRMQKVDTGMKFPSHNFDPGELIEMQWQIAPRIIDQVRAKMKKTGHLFGFKLLNNVPHEELVSAAYEIVLASGATAVFANDRQDLDTVYAVTKERGEHVMRRSYLSEFILACVRDEYYSTCIEMPEKWIPEEANWLESPAVSTLNRMIELNKSSMTTVEKGYIFGTIAVRDPDDEGMGFVTTCRGKNELDGRVKVRYVDHECRKVYVQTTDGSKATLNAPLLDMIFRINPYCQCIVHRHIQDPALRTLPYAPPGTCRDSIREMPVGSFNIEGHGVFYVC